MGWEPIANCVQCGCGPGACKCQPCFICKEVHRRNQFYPCAWNYTGAGFADGGVLCSLFNGTFRLSMIASCYWEFTGGGRTIAWYYNDTESRWELSLTVGGSTILYGISGPLWECCESNTLSYISGEGCATLPETVTVAPVTPCTCPPDPCTCFRCTLCDNRQQQFPCRWRFVGAGFNPAPGFDCDRLNRNLLLSMTEPCVWEYDDPTDVHVMLDLSGANVILTVSVYSPPGNEVFVARYEIAPASWNCCGNNNLPLTQDGNVCGQVPVNIILQPITPCSCGDGGGGFADPTGCCPDLRLPPVLIGTITNVQGCNCVVNGQTVRLLLLPDTPHPEWEGIIQTCDGNESARLIFHLRCLIDTDDCLPELPDPRCGGFPCCCWQLILNCGPLGNEEFITTRQCSCDPFELIWTSLALQTDDITLERCCRNEESLGSFNFTLTT